MHYMLKYALAWICRNMQKKICRNMQKICKYMHLPHEFTSIAYICQNMQKICKICKHEIYMHNMHSPLCWWRFFANTVTENLKVAERQSSGAGTVTDQLRFNCHWLHILSLAAHPFINHIACYIIKMLMVMIIYSISWI